VGPFTRYPSVVFSQVLHQPAYSLPVFNLYLLITSTVVLL